MRFYPVGTPQYGLLYGRRNATESVHRQYKRKAERVPAYGYTRQLLFVIGYVATHNAVARAFHLRRAGKPNALDGILRRRTIPTSTAPSHHTVRGPTVVHRYQKPSQTAAIHDQNRVVSPP
jgi:hypothetical protein